MTKSEFELDPRLASDTHFLANWSLSMLVLMDDARFPWVILVPRRTGKREWFDLDEHDQTQLYKETLAAAASLKQRFDCDKINIGALGNMVSQLHVHVVARRKDDMAWPGPVWGAGVREPYELTRRQHMIGLLRAMPSP